LSLRGSCNQFSINSVWMAEPQPFVAQISPPQLVVECCSFTHLCTFTLAAFMILESRTHASPENPPDTVRRFDAKRNRTTPRAMEGRLRTRETKGLEPTPSSLGTNKDPAYWSSCSTMLMVIEFRRFPWLAELQSRHQPSTNFCSADVDTCHPSSDM
jgi:hypothetical protein